MDFQMCYCANSLDSLNGRVDNNECVIPPGHCAWGESSCSDPIELMPALNQESCRATDVVSRTVIAGQVRSCQD